MQVDVAASFMASPAAAEALRALLYRCTLCHVAECSKRSWQNGHEDLIRSLPPSAVAAVHLRVRPPHCSG